MIMNNDTEVGHHLGLNCCIPRDGSYLQRCILLQCCILCFMTPNMKIVLQNAECYHAVSSLAGQTA